MTRSGPAIALIEPWIVLPHRPPTAKPRDLRLAPGTRTVLMGRSGSGKSLLARLLLGRIPPAPAKARGRVERTLGGETELADLGEFNPGAAVQLLAGFRHSQVGYLPQGGRENLTPGWSLERHLEAFDEASPGTRDRAVGLMEGLGLPASQTTLTSSATELSEGMIRRALLALLLARDTPLLVLDEPTTGLDPKSRNAVLDILQDHLDSKDYGLVVATHDLVVAESLGDQFLRVHNGAIESQCDSLEDGGETFSDFLSARRRMEAAP